MGASCCHTVCRPLWGLRLCHPLPQVKRIIAQLGGRKRPQVDGLAIPCHLYLQEGARVLHDLVLQPNQLPSALACDIEPLDKLLGGLVAQGGEIVAEAIEMMSSVIEAGRAEQARWGRSRSPSPPVRQLSNARTLVPWDCTPPRSSATKRVEQPHSPAARPAPRPPRSSHPPSALSPRTV